MGENEKKECFIIMPISTPDPLTDDYSGGTKHFQLVLDFLFIPAVKDAGYRPIPPYAQ